MDKKTPSHPALKAITGGKGSSPTPLPSPRPAPASGYPGANESILQALRDAQARAAEAEACAQSATIENAGLRGENSALKAQARQLIEANISVAVQGILQAQLGENAELRSELKEIREKHEEALDAANARAEVAIEECRLATDENQRLMHDLEARLSVESFVEMANEELAELKLKYDALRSELTERESAESVHKFMLDELEEMQSELNQLSAILYSDMDTSDSRNIIATLLRHSETLMESNDPTRQRYGFKLQSFLLDHFDDRKSSH